MYFFLILFLPLLVFSNPVPKEEKVEPVAILGGGVGALTSALYLSRANIEPILFEGANPGGLITQSFAVENWPGELEITGADLVEKIRKQAIANGVKFYAEEVVAVDFSKRPFTITVRSVSSPFVERKVRAESCIIAMGTRSNYLGVPGETGPEGYWGRGVSNCAICDGAFYRDRIVGIVGGGDAAVLEGLHLSHIAKEVHLFLRKDAFKAGETKRLDTLLAKPNVHVLYETEVREIKGDAKHVTHVILENKEGELTEFALDGLFLAIGSRPNTELFQGILQLDPEGYIQLHKDQETSIKGVFAIGDIVDPIYKQAISAAGDGARAAIQTQKYLFDRMDQFIAKKEQKNTLVKASPPAVAAASAPSAGVIEIRSKEELDQELKNIRTPIVIDFYAIWCGPCKSIAPQFETAAGRFAGKMKFLKINVDRLYGLAQSYGVTAMPTVIVLDQTGSVLEKRVGSDDIADLLQHLDSLNVDF